MSDTRVDLNLGTSLSFIAKSSSSPTLISRLLYTPHNGIAALQTLCPKGSIEMTSRDSLEHVVVVWGEEGLG